MTAIPDTENWREFFKKYRELPELWQINSDIFRNRSRRKIGWQKLLETYRKIDPNANLDNLKQRINNVRSAFRRELKKVEKSIRSGADVDKLYVPNLWYFKKLEFLRDQITYRSSISMMDANESSDELEDVPKPKAQKRRKPNGKHLAEKNDSLRNTLDNLKNNRREEARDEATIYAESWAISFQKLSGTQRIYAKRAIEEILVLGQLNKLTLNYVQTSCPISSIFENSFSSFPTNNMNNPDQSR